MAMRLYFSPLIMLLALTLMVLGFTASALGFDAVPPVALLSDSDRNSRYHGCQES